MPRIAREAGPFATVLRQGVVRIVLGLAIGLVAALGVSRVFTAIVVNITATDPATFVAISLLLAVVALLACLVPARRATRLDPVNALRDE